MLPANPSLPSDAILCASDQTAVRQWAKRAGITLSFRDRTTGVQCFIKAQTLRERIALVRDGRGEERWVSGEGAAENPIPAKELNPKIDLKPEVTVSIPVPLPVPESGNPGDSKPEPKPNPNADKGAQLFALLASMASIDEEIVRAIVREEVKRIFKNLSEK